VVAHLDRLDGAEPAPSRPGCRRVANRIVGGADVVRGDERAVGEAEVLAQLEHQRGRIDERPLARQFSNTLAMGAAPRERDVKQIRQARRIRVEADARVEALRLAVERHHDPRGGRLDPAAPANERRQQHQDDRKTLALVDSYGIALVPCH
jgi:hypothetical protein